MENKETFLTLSEKFTKLLLLSQDFFAEKQREIGSITKREEDLIIREQLLNQKEKDLEERETVLAQKVEKNRERTDILNHQQKKLDDEKARIQSLMQSL